MHRLHPDKMMIAPRARRTLAFFGAGIREPIVRALWPGLLDAASAHDVNLLYVAGERLRDPANFQAQANVLYDVFDANHVDGMVIWGSTLTDLGQFSLLRPYYRHLPVVNIGRTESGVPSLIMDNYRGMYAAVEHLITGHGYQHLAFIRGLADHFAATERYRAYCDVLAAHGLPVEPALITPPYNWASSYGADAIHVLLDERGLQPHTQIDAIVSANDKMALGAMHALQARGLWVPHAMAVIGFNDDPESPFSTPSLTSVKAPLYELGAQSIAILLDLLDGNTVPERIDVPARLIVRQSCGCVSPLVAQADAGTSTVRRRPGRGALLAAQRGRLLAQIVATSGAEDAGLHCAEQLLDAFIQEIDAGTAGTFLAALHDVLRQAIARGVDPEQCHATLSILRRHALPYLRTRPARDRAENLWQQARTEIGNAEKRWHGAQELSHHQQIQGMRNLSAALLTTFDASGIMDVLLSGLPQIGIPGCALAIYDDPRAPTAGARLMLAYQTPDAASPAERLEIPEDGWRMSAGGLWPDDLRNESGRWTLMVEALYFKEDQIGFIVFEAVLRDGTVYDILRGAISSALQGALLVQRVRANAAEIVQKNYILDAFLENVPDRIYFKDTQGRLTRANSAYAKRYGVESAESLIGKTDFDLSSADIARATQKQESPILRGEQPLFHAEVSFPLLDGSKGWALVTKMPLRDEHGAIIGTFGISRDITDLKKAQQALTQAYSEITVLNTQLQTENVRMSAELNVVKQLQQMILPRPQELTNIPGLDIVGYMQPADEVGGDYYDVLHDHGVLHIGIGDVTGHGLESGVIMLMTQAAIRTLIEHGETDPVKFVNTLNRLIYKNVERMGADKNLTFALVQYQGGQLKLVGQHEEFLVVRQGGQVERMSTMGLGFPVGLEPEIDEWVHAATITLQPGDGLVLYTDGITEAENTAKQQYGLDRLCRVISQQWQQSAEQIKRAVVDDVMAHIGTHTVYDDITLVVLKQQ